MLPQPIQNHIYTESDASEHLPWHEITDQNKNRKCPRSPEADILINRRQANIYWLTVSNNRYSVLANEDTNEITHAEPKPPPIFVDGVEKIQPLCDLPDELTEDRALYTIKTHTTN
jgi:hypothetical protein